MKDFVWWLMSIVVAVGLVYAIPRVLTRYLGTENPTLVVISRSMYPVLHRGDLIFVKKVAPEELKVGTVVVFHHKEGLTVHRVVRLEDRTLTTRGDANTAEDEPIPYEAVVGRLPTFAGRPVKIPLIGRVPILLGPGVEVSQDGVPAPGPPGLVKQLGRQIGNPVGFSLLVLLPLGLLAASYLGDTRGRRGWKGRRQRRAQSLKKRRARTGAR